MKILIVRHGDPDYKNDTLTEVGKLEAEFLKKRIEKENVTSVYCSILGRARDTAKPFLKSLSMDATYCDWLKEFNDATVLFPYNKEPDCCWDVLPEYINTLQNIYHPTLWKEEEFIKNSNVSKNYDYVTKNLDKMLASHGYLRDGFNYKVEKGNHDTIVLVCHFGVTAVLLSHLLNCSPYSIWQHACTAPTAITTIYTEERVKGIALMRCASIGDVSHLLLNGQNPSFSGRFCECFEDDTRH